MGQGVDDLDDALERVGLMGVSTSGGDDDGLIAAINVTPMVDLTLVLLIIFMVAAPLLSSASSIKVNLPKAATAETQPSSPLALTLAREPAGPRLYANGKPTDEAGVRRLVPELLEEGSRPAGDRQR